MFTAPTALAVLADLFATHGTSDTLQAFVSDTAQRVYGVTPPAKEMRLINEPCTVPARYGDVVPMYAGQSIGWSVA